MPSTKISNLPSKATPVAADTLPIVDSVGGLNKKITAGTLPVSTTTTAALVLKADKSIVRSYSASDTWTKPAGLVSVEVQLFSSGGGGGSGTVGAAGTIRYAGASGATGCGIISKFRSADLPSSVTITVGAGGTGGAASSNTVTNTGGTGGTTSFGTLLSLAGGIGGTNTNTPAALFTTSTFELLAGFNGVPANASGGAGGVGVSSPHLLPTPSSGSAGGISSTNTSFNGGAGGARTGIYRPDLTAAGGAAGGANANLCSGTYFGQPMGSGAGGGGSSIITPASNGGSAVGLCGAGAGGGCSQTSTSGAGGNGFRGCIIVIEYY